MNEKSLKDALREVRFPGFRRDLVSLGIVRAIRIDGSRVSVQLDAGTAGADARAQLRQAATDALARLDSVDEAVVRFVAPTGGSASQAMAGARPAVAQAGALDTDLLPGVRRTIAVASGKGGVGKSTVAVNLAAALAGEGLRTGLLDADIYGPSIPLMTGIQDRPQLTPEKKMIPFERFGVRLMSVGFLVDPGSALIWRGPLVMKVIDQLLREVEWGELDVLVVDMPPGTGDVQLTLSQRVRLAGAVIVTTPQDVALADARKGVSMFEKVDVPILGIVENMSFFECPSCSHRTEVFDHGGGAVEARRLGVPFLGELPLDPAVRRGGDCGEPIVLSEPDSPPGKAFRALASRLTTTFGEPGAGGQTIFDRFRDVWRGPSER